MQRRRFVQLALGSVAFASLAGVAACREEGSCELPSGSDADWEGLSRRQRARAVAEAVFGERIEHAILLGEAYLAVPGIDDVMQSFRCEHVEGQPSLQAAVSSMDSAIEADFGARNVVSLQGWVLSATELARCALAV